MSIFNQANQSVHGTQTNIVGHANVFSETGDVTIFKGNYEVPSDINLDKYIFSKTSGAQFNNIDKKVTIIVPKTRQNMLTLLGGLIQIDFEAKLNVSAPESISIKNIPSDVKVYLTIQGTDIEIFSHEKYTEYSYNMTLKIKIVNNNPLYNGTYIIDSQHIVYTSN